MRRTCLLFNGSSKVLTALSLAAILLGIAPAQADADVIVNNTSGTIGDVDPEGSFFRWY